MYNIKQKLGIIIKWSPKFSPHGVHDLYNFLPLSVNEMVKNDAFPDYVTSLAKGNLLM